MDFALPEIGEGVYEAELTAWLVKPGDVVKRGQNLMEIMTDKAAMEVPAPFTGTITALRAEPGQKIKVGEVVLTYTAAGTASRLAPRAAATQRSRVAARPRQTAPPSRRRRTACRSRRRRRCGRWPASSASISPPSPAAAPKDASSSRTWPRTSTRFTRRRPRRSPKPPDYGKPGTRIKFQGLRRKIAEHMVQAKRVIPHYSYVDECDVTELVKLRENLKAAYARAGVKLTYLAFIVKAVVHALKEVPMVNSSLDEAGNEIVLHDRYNIGVAVATPGGLIVPVIHDADKRDLGGVAREIERLGNDARAGRQRLEDLRGGTFSVTSLGNIGGLFSAPIINHPEVGHPRRRPRRQAAGLRRPRPGAAGGSGLPVAVVRPSRRRWGRRRRLRQRHHRPAAEPGAAAAAGQAVTPPAAAPGLQDRRYRGRGRGEPDRRCMRLRIVSL